MIPKKPNQKERKAKAGSKIKRTHIIVPLIIMLILVTIISTILEVANKIKHQTEIAEINRDIETKEEEILARTINPGETYTVPEDGMYKITVTSGNGGDFSSYKGEKGRTVTGYVTLSAGEKLVADCESGGRGLLNKDMKDYIAGGGSGYGVWRQDDDKPMILVRGGYGPKVRLSWTSMVITSNMHVGSRMIYSCVNCGLSWFRIESFNSSSGSGGSYVSEFDVDKSSDFIEAVGDDGYRPKLGADPAAHFKYMTEEEAVNGLCPNEKCNGRTMYRSKVSSSNVIRSMDLQGGLGGYSNELMLKECFDLGYVSGGEFNVLSENMNTEKLQEGVEIIKMPKVTIRIKFGSELDDCKDIVCYERFTCWS